MEKSLSYIKICRYLWIIGPILGTLWVSPIFIKPIYILATLFILINSQVRILTLKGRIFILSLVVEMMVILYLASQAGGFIILILFSSLMDAVLQLKLEGYPIALLLGGGLFYSLYTQRSLEWAGVMGLIYLAFFLLLLHLKMELGFRRDTEVLYDQIRRNNYELEEAKARLYSYSKQVERVSQLEERHRISRELHDTLGHDLIGILMQVDAARQILPLDQERGMDLLDSVYENINGSIEHVRSTVRRFKPKALENYLESIQGLIGKCQQDTGLNIEYRTFGQPYELYPSVEIALYKNIREALTNAIRHGSAQKVTIRLYYREESIEMVISDDGRGAGEIKKGLGLTGMEERMELVGGSVSYSGSEGFTITMRIPRREY